MSHILFGNPEAFREWQYRHYQERIANDEELYELGKCVVCGSWLYDETRIEILKNDVPHDVLVCHDCINNEMADSECEWDVAVANIKSEYV